MGIRGLCNTIGIQVGNAKSFNVFAYMFNNPTSGKDSDGNWPKLSTVFGVIAVTGLVVAAVAITVATCGAAATALVGVGFAAGISAATVTMATTIATGALIVAGVAGSAAVTLSKTSQTNRKKMQPNHTVYKLTDPLDGGKTKYVGRTISVEARKSAHANDPGKQGLTFEIIKSGLNYYEARGLEQIAMIEYNTKNWFGCFDTQTKFENIKNHNAEEHSRVPKGNNGICRSETFSFELQEQVNSELIVGGVLMKWLKAVDNHVILVEYGKTLSHTLIGFYTKNYVLGESKGQYGITYLVDDMFYNYLWDVLPNVEDIQSRTTYFYSEYLIHCKREETHEILETIEEAITFFKNIRLDEMKKLRSQYVQSHFSPKVPTLERYFEDFYYEQKRFGVSISGRTEGEKWTDKQMQAWIKHSWAENFVFLCICNPPAEMTFRRFGDSANDLQQLTLSRPQRFTARGKDDICCIQRDQKEIQIICALDCPSRVLKSPFLVEALCYVWESRLKKINLEGYEVLEIPALCMDAVAPHIRFEFSISSDYLNEFLDGLIQILCRRPSSIIFTQAITKTLERAHRFREDALEMNRMAAANYYAGSPYNMEDYVCPQKALTQPYGQFLDLQTLLAKKENFSLLYAGKEKYLLDIKNSLALFNL